MNDFQRNSYAPLRDWFQSLDRQSWRPQSQPDDVYKAFLEAIRFSVSQPKAFFEVAERIRRIGKVDWEKLHEMWERALKASKGPGPNGSAVVMPRTPQNPPPSKPANIKPHPNHNKFGHGGNNHKNGHHPLHRHFAHQTNGAPKQRSASSLASYYV